MRPEQELPHPRERRTSFGKRCTPMLPIKELFMYIMGLKYWTSSQHTNWSNFDPLNEDLYLFHGKVKFLYIAFAHSGLHSALTGGEDLEVSFYASCIV